MHGQTDGNQPNGNDIVIPIGSCGPGHRDETPATTLAGLFLASAACGLAALVLMGIDEYLARAVT